MKGGIKRENIIYFTYHAEVNTSINPFPGKVFTDPAPDTSGDWAQYGCFNDVDYSDKELSRDLFLAILSGDVETARNVTGRENPKVLSAGPDDTVFTYFIDHGDAGLILVGFQAITDEMLMDALNKAHEKQLYGKWVWFMEACFSGSMFPKLPEDVNIYVMTAADAEHSAYMSNCPPDDAIAGVHLGPCLSSIWDEAYMVYLEEHPEGKIGELVDAVKEEVKKDSDQNVSEFGDKSFRDLPLSDFFGAMPASRHGKRESKSIVSVDAVPRHLAMWEAIRADKNELENAMNEYERIVKAEAKKEVEVMRLGVALMNEKGAAVAMKNGAESYSIDCVRDLSLGLVKKCGHSIPMNEKTMNLLRSICLPGLSTPEVNWSDICME